MFATESQHERYTARMFAFSSRECGVGCEPVAAVRTPSSASGSAGPEWCAPLLTHIFTPRTLRTRLHTRNICEMSHFPYSASKHRQAARSAPHQLAACCSSLLVHAPTPSSRVCMRSKAQSTDAQRHVSARLRHQLEPCRTPRRPRAAPARARAARPHRRAERRR